jgi:hypothetical protein
VLLVTQEVPTRGPDLRVPYPRGKMREPKLARQMHPMSATVDRGLTRYRASRIASPPKNQS